MNDTNLKNAICDALATWVRQRPGLNPHDYEPEGYRRAQRQVAIDKRDAEMLLVAVRGRDSITGERLIEAAKHSFGGRLEIKIVQLSAADYPQLTESERFVKVEIDYSAGQDETMEYRAAAAAVLASALWEHVRDSRPAANGKLMRQTASGYAVETDNIDGVSAGDWMRRHFRKEFGSRLQRRWFN